MTRAAPAISTQRNAILRIYRGIDEDTAAFSAATGLVCPPGCGRCCENPRVDATVVEMVPAALWLVESGLAEEFRQRAEQAHGAWCIFFEPQGDGLGRCGAYAWRPTICRLFGFAGVRRKGGARELAACAVHSGTQPDVVTSAMEQVEEGLNMPVFEDAARKVLAVHPEDGRIRLPINDALLLALERVVRRGV